MLTLRASEQDWQHILRLTRASFTTGGIELGAIGLLGENRTRDRHELLVTNVVSPEPGDVTSTDQHLTFSANYLRRAHLEARRRGLAGVVTFHTHPHARSRVGFSPYDDQQDPLLAANLQELAPGTKLVSIVLGASSQAGRIWHTPTRPDVLRELVIVGETLRFLPLHGREKSAPPTASSIFDRGAALSGAGALEKLAQLRIAIVGASGTGSLVAELLARAGCKQLILIDPDTVEHVNLNRILHAGVDDAETGRPKVALLKSRIETLLPDCQITAVQARVPSDKALAHLRNADVIFGCLDDAASARLALSKFAYQYLRPLIDVGSEIGTTQDGQQAISLDARVTYVAPGRPCLRCAGLIDPERLALETLTAEERARQESAGYAKDLLLAQPAVMDLNMRAASLGTLLLRHLLQPFLQTPLPTGFLENVVTLSHRKIERARHDDEACDVCKRNPQLGAGASNANRILVTS